MRRLLIVVVSLTLPLVLTANVAVAAVGAHVQVTNFQFTPATSSVAQGQSVRWHFNEGTHTAEDATPMGAFDSGFRSVGSTFTWPFSAAGTYPFLCGIHPSEMTGDVRVPLIVQSSSATKATLRMSTITAPTGYVHDLQVKRPGGVWQDFRRGVTNRLATYTATQDGTHRFRARLRRPGSGAALWSTPVLVTFNVP